MTEKADAALNLSTQSIVPEVVASATLGTPIDIFVEKLANADIFPLALWPHWTTVSDEVNAAADALDKDTVRMP